MKRREALKNIGLSFASITISASTLSLVQSCQSSSTNLKFFNSKRLGLIDRIFEIIIPETDTPGSNTLNLSKFTDAYIYKNISLEEQKELNEEIDEFLSVILSNENKKSISDIEDEKLEKHLSNHLNSDDFKDSNGNNYSELCRLMRRMAVSSYKTSEYVMTNLLGYVPIPGYYDGSVDV